MGGGSSQVRAFYEVTPLQGIRELCGNDVKVLFAPGYEVKRGAVASDRQIQEAVALARSADAVIYVGGSFHGYDYSVWADNAYDAEDTDKPDMYLPFGQDRLIRSVVQANPKTAVVLFGGGATDMSGWFASVPSILQCWYPGMEGGRALARILFGAVNPSGKLPMTFPKKLEDHPAHQLGEYPGDLTKNTVYYYDDIYVGYRYYDTYGVAPLFPFGHGLSYTQFTYDSLRIVTTDNAVEVRFIVRNTGTIKGADVAQVYVHPEQSVLPRPDQELKGFSKVELLPGESKELRIRLGPDAFSYYNDLRNDWVTDPGSYTIRVGASSRDIRLSGSVSRN
jgi:beta-glucosidase